MKFKAQLQKIDKLNTNLEILGRSTTSKIDNELRRINAILSGSTFDDDKGPNGAPAVKNQNNIMKIVDRKIERSEFEQKLSIKSNKKDMEMAIRLIHTLHKHIIQLSQLVSTEIRDTLESSTLGETEQAKMNRRQNLLQNALLVSKWIQQFDSKNINDCFET